MHNITALKPEECCGCTACYASCPTKAITMQPDEVEGFLYPRVDEEKCIDCSKCLRVCQDVRPYQEEQKIYACWSKDDGLRARSSSGGIFSLLAEKVLANGGAVCAVGYSEDCKECLHKIIFSPDDLDDLRRAKFVQSTKYDVYQSIKDLVGGGRNVLFCGTPCEVGGLRQFLGKEYDNLITCDIICGCVSSPMVYRTYIEYLNDNHKANAVSVNFKDKRKGWRGKAIAVGFDDGTEYYNSILDDDYCVSFHSRYNIRPSCFSCKYGSLQRFSDITLGDFWAIEIYQDDIDDNKGTSFVLTSTEKGRLLIERLSCETRLMEINLKEYADKYNLRLYISPNKMDEQKRLKFFHDVKQLPFDQMSLENLQEIKEERKRRNLQSKYVITEKNE